MTIAELLFSFTGRINRGRYWTAVAIYVGGWLIFLAVLAAIFFNSVSTFVQSVTLADIGPALVVDFMGRLSLAAILIMVAGVLTFISMLAVTVKRLHDRDRSGWWALLFLFVPSMLNSAAASQPSGTAQTIFSLAGATISIWAFIELAVLRGTVGPNRFGPDMVPEPYRPPAPQPPRA